MATVRIVDQIDENIGSMLIGTIVSAVLLGVSLVQTYYYYTTYPKDPWFLKTLVAIVTVFDTVHCALITHTVYHYCISSFNRPAELERLVWSLVIEALFTGVTGSLVQCFYLQRIWRLSKNWILTGIILILILAATSCGTVWIVFAIHLDTYQKLLEMKPITITINELSTAVDVLIAASLWYLLAKARTGFKRSDTLINKLILFVISTGALTTAFAAASMVSLLVSPNTLIYVSFYFSIGRLYTNSLLATLNARNILKAGNVDDVSHILVSIPSTFTNSVNGAKGSSGAKNSNLAIRVGTTTVKHQNHLHPSDRHDLDTKQPIESDEFIDHETRLAQTTGTN